MNTDTNNHIGIQYTYFCRQTNFTRFVSGKCPNLKNTVILFHLMQRNFGDGNFDIVIFAKVVFTNKSVFWSFNQLRRQNEMRSNCFWYQEIKIWIWQKMFGQRSNPRKIKQYMQTPVWLILTENQLHDIINSWIMLWNTMHAYKLRTRFLLLCTQQTKKFKIG